MTHEFMNLVGQFLRKRPVEQQLVAEMSAAGISRMIVDDDDGNPVLIERSAPAGHTAELLTVHEVSDFRWRRSGPHRGQSHLPSGSETSPEMASVI